MNTESQVLNVPIEDIIPNRFQPRLNFDEQSLKELAASIKEHGIIQPLVLRRLNDKYEIIAGERRYKAAKMAGLTSVPAVIAQMDDNTSAEVAIVENIQRRDLSSIEEAKSYKALLDKGYLTQEDLAKKMGLSQSAISNKLRLLTLPEEVQNAIMEGKISERHARSLLQLESADAQKEWLNKIIDERITVRDLDTRLKNLNKKEETQVDDIPIIDNTPNIAAIKEKATDILAANNPSTSIESDSEEVTPTKIPNKFFNFLEDESVNMNVGDVNKPKIETPVTPSPESAISTEETSPVAEVSQNVEVTKAEPTEEVEMLDFLAPEPTPSEPVVSETKEEPTSETPKKDMNAVKDYVGKLEDDLRDNDYKVSISREEDEKEIRYIVTVSKE